MPAPVSLALHGAPSAIAADNTPGTCMLEGGSYSFDFRSDGDGFVVVERNSDLRCARIDGDEFHFHNDATQTPTACAAWTSARSRPSGPMLAGNPSTRLALSNRAAGEAAVDAGDSARYEALAQDHHARIESDPDSVQARTSR